jgi:hypothetical protein
MSSGVIVVTSGTGGTQEVIRHGIDGLVFENQNHISLAQALHSLHTNAQLRNTLQVNARSRAFEFSVNKSVERIENLAAEMLRTISMASPDLQIKTEKKIQCISEIQKRANDSKYNHIISDLKAFDKIGEKRPKVYVYRHEKETGAPLFPMQRQTFFGAGVAGGFEFTESSFDEAEFAVVFGGPSCPPFLESFEKKKRICILMENPQIWAPSQEYLSKMGVIVCPFPIDVPSGSIFINQQAAVPWFYGLKFRTDVGLMHMPKETSLQLEDLALMQMPEKSKLLSCIASRKAFTEGHRWRIMLAEKLQKYFGKDIDLYGFGWNAIEQKQQAIDSYKYHIVIENAASDHYWTEKLSDAMLGYTIPIYAGALKVNNYFDSEIPMIQHGGDVDQILAKIKAFTKKEYSHRNLIKNKNNVLYKHNLYYMLAEIIQSHCY